MDERGTLHGYANRVHMRLTLPTILTIFRIALLPVMVVVFYAPFRGANIAASAVFIAAALTDWLDGWVARRYGMTSAFGEFLDPVADKLMVCSALLVLLKLQRVDAFVALVIIGREITISALREWMAEIGQRRKVAVSQLGKYKTILQIVGLTCMLFRIPLLGLPIYNIGVVLTEVAAAATLYSMVAYLQAAWPELRR